MEIAVGNFVKIDGQESVGEVLSIKGNNLEVAIGIMKLVVKKSKVSLAQQPTDRSEYDYPQAHTGSGAIDIKDKLQNFQFELDVRGKMKDEVMTLLTTWTDDAIFLGIGEAKILHGKGTGVIKDTVRSFLKKYKEVLSLVDAEKFLGGEGVTVVKFVQ